jgi:hypothetical protein
VTTRVRYTTGVVRHPGWTHRVWNAEHLPMLAAKADSPEPIGFLSLRRQTSVATVAYVLGVRPEWHRAGAWAGCCSLPLSDDC